MKTKTTKPAAKSAQPELIPSPKKVGYEQDDSNGTRSNKTVAPAPKAAPKAPEEPAAPPAGTMKAAVAWVKDVLATKDLVHHLTHYLIKDGMIHGSDGRMVAAHPFDCEASLLIPGEKFEKLLMAMPVDSPELTMSGPVLTLKHNRFKGQITTIVPDAWPYGLEYEGPWKPVTEEFLAGIKAVRPFVSDNATQAWATAVGMVPGFAYATNNVIIARAPIPKWKASILIPAWAIDFIIKRTEGLKEFAVTESHILFRWENGGWMKTNLVSGVFPDKAGGMIDSRPLPTVAITPEWRALYNRLAPLVTDDQLALYVDHMQGRSGEEMQVEDEGGTPVPPGRDYSLWNPTFLTPVIEASTHWDPTAWPSPARFKGELVEGILVGRVAK